MSNTTPAIYHNGHFYGNEVGNMTLMDNKLNKLSDNIAPKQDSDTASKLIDVGEYFINKDGYLCQCDIQIANQGAITVGTNCHMVPNGLANELSSIGGGGYPSIKSWINFNVDTPNYNPYIVWRNGDGDGRGTLPSTSAKAGFVVNQPIEFESTVPYILQIFYDYNGTGSKRWHRYYNGSSWTGWF